MCRVSISSNYYVDAAGIIAVDSCFNKLRTNKELIEILSGQRKLCYKGDCLDPAKIVAAIGDYSSTVTIEVCPMVCS